ncbi:MAG: type II secretion system GspH family protein [Armatimonadota bacterium]|nr:type II secretion system GspH family protein [Armatimonadota bacterium]
MHLIKGKVRVRAFSLFELLAAILIVAILMAILLAVFLKAKGAAKQTGCLQNLRQIGAAHILYSIDHDGWYPPYATTTARGRKEGLPWIKGDPEALKKCLMAYKVDEAQFWCPLDPYKGDEKVIGYFESAGVHRNSFMSYQHHWVLTSSPSSFGTVDGAFRFNPDVFPERIREGVFGSGKVTYFHDFTWVKEYKHPSGDPLQASPHKERANFLATDGSVHFLNVDQPETVPLP